MKCSLKNSKNLYLYEIICWIHIRIRRQPRCSESPIFSAARAQCHSHRFIRRPTAHLLLLIVWREELQRTSLRHQISRANVISVILLIFCALVQVL